MSKESLKSIIFENTKTNKIFSLAHWHLGSWILCFDSIKEIQEILDNFTEDDPNNLKIYIRGEKE